MNKPIIMDNLNLRDYISQQMGSNQLMEIISKQAHFSRNKKEILIKFIDSFLKGDLSTRWIVLPGLRGVGKTTLLAQVYQQIYQSQVRNQPDNNKLNMVYLSLDIIQRLGGNIMESIQVYESILGYRLENVPTPILLFIDETQLDPDWAKFLKTVYDRTRNVFIICTGSSATYLQMDADTAGRRALIERLYPLNFIEYQMLAHNKQPNISLKNTLYRICYLSASATEAYQDLQALESAIDLAWAEYDPNQIEDYLQTGTLPFALQQNKTSINKILMESIDKVIINDLVPNRRFGFNHSSITTIKQLLVLLANSPSTPSLQNLSKRLKKDAKNISEMLEALVKAEVLIRIPAYSNSLTSSRPVRYQFMTSALRNAHWHITGRKPTAESRRGQLLEDIAALHYYQEFIAQGRGALNYAYSANSLTNCDFILKITNSHQIALEFGLGSKTAKQVHSTMSKIDCDYGLVFSESPLSLDKTKNIVMVPLRVFFLM